MIRAKETQLYKDVVAKADQSAIDAMAEVMPVGKDIANRLLTDPQMKTVWHYLKRVKVETSALETLPLNQRLSNWGIDDYNVSANGHACAAFLAHIVLELGVPKEAATRFDVSDLIAPWRRGAAQCRFALSIPGRPSFDKELAKALSTVEGYFEEQANFIEQANANNPYVLSKSKENDITRVWVRAIAKGSLGIFGSPFYGIVAKTATVALNLNRETKINEEQVRDWCVGLKPRQ
jgi:hypothetical protein